MALHWSNRRDEARQRAKEKAHRERAAEQRAAHEAQAEAENEQEMKSAEEEAADSGGGPGSPVAGCYGAATREEPPPDGDGADVARLVQEDIEKRAEEGQRKYGERLTTGNGRDPLVDAYQEALDLCMYLRQQIEEQAAP